MEWRLGVDRKRLDGNFRIPTIAFGLKGQRQARSSMEYRAISRVQVLAPVAQIVLFGCVLTAAGQTNCLPPPSGLVSWWQGETNALDEVGANDGTLQNGASFGPGMVGQAFTFNGASQFVYVPDAPSLNPQDAMTLEGWVYAADNPATDSMVVVAKDDAGSSR